MEKSFKFVPIINKTRDSIMKSQFIFFILFVCFSYAKKIQSLKGSKMEKNIFNLESYDNKKIIPFNQVSKTQMIFIYDSKNNRVEYINHNQDDIEYSKSTYVIEKNKIRLISVIDCIEENCR